MNENTHQRNEVYPPAHMAMDNPPFIDDSPIPAPGDLHLTPAPPEASVVTGSYQRHWRMGRPTNVWSFVASNM